MRRNRTQPRKRHADASWLENTLKPGRAPAPVGEVIRGLFQCVKYEVVLDAEARVTGSRADCEAVLALGGSFPGELTPLRHTLRVKVFENLG